MQRFVLVNSVLARDLLKRLRQASIDAPIIGSEYGGDVYEQVFIPAGSENTGWFEQDKSVPHVAVGYTYMRAWGDRPGDEMRV